MSLTQRKLTEEQNTRLQEIERLAISLNETFSGNVELLSKEIRDVEMNNRDSIEQLRGKFKYYWSLVYSAVDLLAAAINQIKRRTMITHEIAWC